MVQGCDTPMGLVVSVEEMSVGIVLSAPSGSVSLFGYWEWPYAVIKATENEANAGRTHLGGLCGHDGPLLGDEWTAGLLHETRQGGQCEPH